MKTYVNKCVECTTIINKEIVDYSLYKFNQPLCDDCQNWLEEIKEYTSATPESINLYFALKKRDVPAKIEKNDGFKTIDISVPDAKVNIEVDGSHHKFDAKQALSDLKRTYHSFKNDGFLTLRIPNSLAQNFIEDTADLITDFLIENKDRNEIIEKKEIHLGYCLRCSDKIDFNPKKPLCSSCYNEWSNYHNYSYPENNCHCCGDTSRTSMKKPVCHDCYKNLSAFKLI